MIEYALENAELILEATKQIYQRSYLDEPNVADLLFGIASQQAHDSGYPIAPSTTAVFAIEEVFLSPTVTKFASSVPHDTNTTWIDALNAGVGALNHLAFMKFCESEADPQTKITRMVSQHILDKKMASQMEPLCRPMLSRLKKGVADEELVDLLESNYQPDLKAYKYSPAEILGISTMLGLYRQTYPQAKLYHEAETRKRFDL